MASALGNEEFVKWAISKGIDVNRENDDGYSALMAATPRAFLSIMTILIQKGADVNHKNHRSETALHLLRDNGIKAAEILINSGANLNARNHDGRTPIFMAIQSSDKELVRYLLDRGADINQRDNMGRTPLFIAIISLTGDDASYFVQNMIRKYKASVRIDDMDWNTPLHIAVMKGDLQMVKVLLLNGASKEMENKNGFTAYDLARYYKNKDIINAFYPEQGK